MFKTIKLSKLLVAVLAMLVLSAGAFTCFSGKAQVNKEEKSAREGIEVPIIMYHSVQLDPDKCNEYTVTLDQLESDIEYIKQNNFTPVFMNDLIRYVNYNGELPDKPIVLTFDDGFYNNYEYMIGLLKKEKVKAVISVVGSYTINASESGDVPSAAYSYLRWCDINEMRESGYYEFCNHSYDMHKLEDRKGVLKRSDESPDAYRHALITDIDGLQKLFETNCDFRPNVFTYPYGFNSEASEETLKALGFEATLGVEEKPNYIVKGCSECLYRLNRYNRSGLTDTESFMKVVLGNSENS
ncbi:polysaccharide deacetylase family protein [Ruminococcus sp.]|uniref:polysaccharide deacetylase family protein n=1 Tax=Ruminococcus sp. TaxID=41978 RepID=UPI0025CD81F8|nr:polysaccharide deacetylase family protein [Ruminococcus sp.]MBQ8965279.1 polysaccharide deacetylase family protein [Ruminococcus sp.]